VGVGNGLRQTGYTFLIFFVEKGSNTSDQETGPPSFENVVVSLVRRGIFERVMLRSRCAS